MSEIAKITALDGVTYDIKDALARQTIPYGQVDSTSTATAFTATVPGVTELRDGTCMLLRNATVTSASGFTININGLGAKPCYSNMATGNPVTPTDPSRETTIFNINYTMLFVYSEDIISGGGWICYRGYDSNSNTIGYQLRTNSSSKKMSDVTYRYRIFFESADGTLWVPANTSSSTNATASRTVNQRAINPFGDIVYYGSTTSVSAGSTPGASSLWQEYTLTLGYSFNRTGAALVLPYPKPIYIKCAPQANGSAIIDASTPYVTALPTGNDGKIYIYLGRTYSATSIEMVMCHPVYYHDGTGIRLWTGKTIPTKTSELTNDSGFITGYTETDPVFAASAASGITSTDISNWNNKSDFSGSYNDLDDKPTIPSVSATQLLSTGTKIGSVTVNSTTTDFYAPTSGGITTETDPVFAASAAHGISSTDISNWNNKSDFSGSYNDLTDKPTIPDDTKVTQTATASSTYTYWGPLLIGDSAVSEETGAFSTTTNGCRTFDNVRVQPSTGTIKATTFKGNLTGNVTGDVTGTASGNLTSNSTLNPAKLSGVAANTKKFLRSDGTWEQPTIGDITAKQHGIMEMLNPFDPGLGKIYIDRLENAFYFLDKRYSVTGYTEDGEGNQTALTTTKIAQMFDMSEVDSNWPAAGQKAVITMDFTGASGTGTFPNYPYGYLCVNFYNNEGPESVSVRVYGKHTGTTPYWTNLTVTDASNGTNQLRYIANQGVMYNMMKLEVTIQAKSDKNASMSEISYYLVRSSYQKDMPYFSKLKAEKFYFSPTAPDYLLSNGTSVATALGTIPSASSTAPSDLGTAAAGSSSNYARADHVHNKPTYSATEIDHNNEPISDILGGEQTASGNIVTFTDVTGGNPFTVLTVDIDPVQSGSGDPSPSNVRPISGWSEAKVTRTGENLYDPSTTEILNAYIGATTNEILAGNVEKTMIIYLPAGTYSVTKETDGGNNPKLAVCSFSDHPVIGSVGTPIIRVDGKSAVFTVSSDAWVAIWYYNGASADGNLDYCQQHTSLCLYYSITIDLDGTRYGGTLNVLTGELTVTDTGGVLDGSEGWQRSASDTNAWFYRGVSGTYRAGVSAVYTSHFKSVYNQVNSAWMIYGQIHVHPDTTIAPSGNTDAGLAEFKAWLAQNNVDFYTKLATPLVIQLTPHEMKSLLGVNNVWANTGDVTVSVSTGLIGAVETMKEDPGIYIGNTEPSDSNVRVWIDTDDDASRIVDLVYPVGSIYMSVNSSSPAVLFGGTWERIQDTFLLAAGNTYSGGGTGGAEKHTHEYGIQYGTYYYNTVFESNSNAGVLDYAADGTITVSPGENYGTSSSVHPSATGTATGAFDHGRATGNASYESNMPPYLVVYMWKRTA